MKMKQKIFLTKNWAEHHMARW